jgi:hypothetical protein
MNSTIFPAPEDISNLKTQISKLHIKVENGFPPIRLRSGQALRRNDKRCFRSFAFYVLIFNFSFLPGQKTSAPHNWTYLRF